MKKALLWFRNNLRIHDNEALFKAYKENDAILCVYCFDPKSFEESEFGIPKMGPHRAAFLREAVADLRENIRKLGGELVILFEEPEVAIPELVEQYGIQTIYTDEEVTDEELRVDEGLEEELEGMNVRIKMFWSSTLVHIDDLPFDQDEVPDLFTNFRTKLEQDLNVRPCFELPDQLVCIKHRDVGIIPSFNELGVDEPALTTKGVLPFVGGESNALARLKSYIWETDSLRTYKLTRNGLLGADYSSKFSPWLTFGCLSPRYIYEQVKKYEEERVKNDSTYWLIFELLWRDFFRFTFWKNENKLFQLNGIQPDAEVSELVDDELFNKWRHGKLDVPFIDANMIELKKTGFMSNRGRQNVASYFVHELKMDWRIGAAYFEYMLIDYDVCSNWGNWAYLAGVGNDARSRVFNIEKQAEQYDPQGKYTKYWLK